jgi:putative transcriptional regulator
MESLRGSLLIAHPSLKDPYFRNTVLLITEHRGDGTIGVVLNKPIPPSKITDATYRVYEGGPVPHPKCMVLHSFEKWPTLQRPVVPDGVFLAPSDPVAPGIYLGDGFDLVRISKLGLKNQNRYRVINGYASWSPGQLEAELKIPKLWYVAPARGFSLWNVTPEHLWPTIVPKTAPGFSIN